MKNKSELPRYIQEDKKSNDRVENEQNNSLIGNEDELPNQNIDSNLDLKNHPILLDFSMMDALFFGAVISSTDPVAALTFIHDNTEPKLFAILFGEGVLNDAVSIVIYKILTDFQRGGGEFTFSSIIGMFGTFVSLIGWSFVIGLSIGIIGSLILKSLKKYVLEGMLSVH